jgi:hypothetical protein
MMSVMGVDVKPPPKENMPRPATPTENCHSVGILATIECRDRERDVLGSYTSLILPLKSRKLAKVSENALISHTASAALMPMSSRMTGMAENSAELLNASMNCARQKRRRRVYRRRNDSLGTFLRSTRVSAGEVDGGGCMAGLARVGSP